MRTRSRKLVVVGFFVWFVLMVVIGLGLSWSAGGCALHSRAANAMSINNQSTAPTLSDKLLSQSDKQIIIQTVKSTDYLMTIFIVVSVLGIIAGLHGLKSGWMVVAACVAGAGMKAAFSISATYLVSAAVFAGIIITVMLVVAIKSMKAKINLGAQFQDAFKDVVGTVQNYKDDLGAKIGLSDIGARSMGLEAKSALSTIKGYLLKQKPETQVLVKEVKAELTSEVTTTEPIVPINNIVVDTV